MTFGMSEKKILPVSKLKITVLSLLGLFLASFAVALALIKPLSIVAKLNTKIAPNSPIFELLKKKLHGVHVHAYLFNVTNAERFQAGLDDRMKVEEVGPFTYLETRVNENIELDMEEGLIKYNPKNYLTFVPELSVADPKDVNITMPNMAFLAIASMISSYSPVTHFLFDMMSRKLRSKAIVSMDAYTYLWGYEEPLITFGHNTLPGFVNFNKIGILDRMYNDDENFDVVVSARNADKFQIRSVNGEGGLTNLGFDTVGKRSKCNSFTNAYEGYGFPPGITPETDLRIWRNTMCRMVELDYYDEADLEYGAHAYLYKISNRTYDYNPDKQCLCVTEECYNGISLLSPCYFGLPLAISNGHFLGGEPRLFNKIEGLEPDEEKHGSRIMVEPLTGIMVDAHFTVQMNIVVNNVNYLNEASAFSDMVLPIAYFKMVQKELPEDMKHKLNLICYVGPKVIIALEVSLFLIGISLVLYCVRKSIWSALLFSAKRGMSYSVPESEKPKPSSEVPLMISSIS